MWKKWGSNQWFCSCKKASSTWKKVFSKKRFFQFICADIFKTMSGNFLIINRSRDVSVSVILKLWKMVLHNKIINKTRSRKNQENSAHGFVDNYLTNHLPKFQQDRIKPWRVAGFRVCTGYHFFKRKSLVRAF